MRHPVRRTALAAAAAASLLAVGVVAPAQAEEVGPSELIISEYVEGSSNNKAVELYNPTSGTIDLTEYTLEVYSNGNTTRSVNATLEGSLAAGDAYVFADDGAVLPEPADQITSSGLWNGNDAIVLKHSGTVVDSIGQVGDDSSWGTDVTLRRMASVCIGDTIVDDAFDPATEWVGFAQNTFDGLGSHTVDCDGTTGPSGPVINEFSADTTGTDLAEYVEVYGDPDTDLSAYSVLSIEGDGSSATGTVDRVIPLGTTDADGLYLADLASNSLENGTMSLLLVEGFTGAAGDDLDADDDGELDAPMPWTALVDAVAVHDGGSGDLAYGGTVLGPNYDGLSSFDPGGASRIPDGFDTDAPSDWVRNAFNGAGTDAYPGAMPVVGEAWNTPGAPNEVYVAPPLSCTDEPVTIGSVQGTEDASAGEGEFVIVRGVVVGDFQDGGFAGYYIQDAGDGDSATSDGIFVYAPGGAPVDVGDEVIVAGAVSEYFGLTEITPAEVVVCDTGVELPAATELTLPATEADREAVEGMLVTLPQELAILEFYNYGRYGLISIGTERQYTPTAVVEPGQPAIDLAEQNALNRIGIDDGRSTENPDPAIHPNGEEFTLDNTFRGGDLLTNVTGVLDYRFSTWSVQQTQGADYESVNPRPEVPEVGGTTTVSSFNVLNYFTTLNSRGANTLEELARQEAKIVAALAEIDADVFGLIEIENNGDEGADSAVATLVDALNDAVGAGTYAYVDTGVIGTDEIATAFIFKPATVTPVGAFALLDSSVDPRFIDTENRPALAQTFADPAGEEFTVVVNHLKSKGSSCEEIGDADLGDGAGNCNLTRTAAAAAMTDWIATDPTGTGTADRALIIGDLNSYDHEDPIDVFTGAGYTDLLLQQQGEYAYSYVFDGQLGYLDYALAGTGLVGDVTGAAPWNINADEPSLIDYDMSFKKPAQDALYAPDPYRSSDHDPVIVGLQFDTTPPEISVEADPATVFPPTGAWTTVDLVIDATDDSGLAPTVEIVDATADGKKSGIEVLSDDQVQVIARIGATYTVTVEATDYAGNTASDSVVISVTAPRGRWMQ
ncbi:ExeM/NucH family extracellular endonuclease [Agromyces sp. SYSU T00194]|uniref:ExeM/NucH family extracellular endonuclease n=1 Tax=Agromyces chitinivorans TaxID=3158560 RepID=UPI003392CB6B